VIVLDASAAAELVLETAVGASVGARLRGEAIHAPAHLDIETVGVIRRAVLRDLISERDGLAALGEFLDLPVRRWPTTPFVARAYELRHTHTVADATYIALAEQLPAVVVTCDRRLANAHGHAATVELLE